MTVESLNELDLSYTPPLSSPWDPVQMAAELGVAYLIIQQRNLRPGMHGWRGPPGIAQDWRSASFLLTFLCRNSHY